MADEVRGVYLTVDDLQRLTEAFSKVVQARQAPGEGAAGNEKEAAGGMSTRAVGTLGNCGILLCGSG